MAKKIETTKVAIQVVGGVDTHQDLDTAAVVSTEGEILGVKNFSTTRAGYRAMLAWFGSHGELLRVGVEATGSYGAAITRHLALAGVLVLEVTGPDAATRREYGKDDSIDALSAARAALTGQRTSVAKDRPGAVEALRVLWTTHKTAVRCRRATLQQIHDTVVASPEEFRDLVRHMTRMQLIRTCAAWQPDTIAFRNPVVATKMALKSLAQRFLGWVSRTAASSWLRLETTRSAFAPRQGSPCSAEQRRCQHQAARSNVTD